MTMDEIVRRLEKAEKKTAALEETLETIKQMNISEQMQEYIESRQRTVQLTGLLNSLSGQGVVDTSEAERQIAAAQAKKNIADAQIREAMASAAILDAEAVTPAALFTYERYTYIAKAGIRITGYNGFDEKTIAIPAYISGLPVISIGRKAFCNGSMEEVVLPQSILEIDEAAFKGCSSLRKINVPQKIFSIGASAFSSCLSLKTIQLPEGLEVLGKWCFSNSGIERINFPSTIEKIPSYCCQGCKKLQTVSIEDGVKTIAEEAFSYDWSYRRYGDVNHLSKIVIPKSVKTIESKAFNDRKETLIACLGMETVGDSQRYSSDTFAPEATIYVIPGSAMQKYARDHNMKIKPLTEFPVE